ncbi:RagB/SusD family nutrient uptake outer membrane protein [Arthrospiribacter ruber]|uniref:RagB/SusD family nutrient uptake outer membrane protein n=1 Tax=Arthrospiribacter ruber TaxID=2487934 RepID=A0A951J2T4_9BACT|nr:RagB/SusD family nutrient uptake outer membrane protein [Arthrospiribacter ruber]MBW3469533.1 RagB/SusD family nutrient uptake outer membrane protein [Arthrospiribacter ruber]
MKYSIRIIYITFTALLFNACADLDLTPKTGISTENFFRNLPELEIGLNALYERRLWKIDEDWWTDDMFHRGFPITNDIVTANINSESNIPGSYWTDLYDGIKRANTVLQALENLRGIESENELNRIEGEARAIRAYFYGVLVTKFGDVPLLTTNIPLNEAYDVTRTGVEEVKNFIYSELDEAAILLPRNNENRANQGFALGIKARIALYLGDFQTSKAASQAVIDLGIYELDDNFRTLFLKEGAASRENIYFIPQSQDFNVNFDNSLTRDFIPRNAGGFGAALPTFEAIHVFECTDGNTIDNSPLYDPRNPFENRDPRLIETIVEFGTPWLGFIYQPHPDSVTTLNVLNNSRVTNNDSRGVAIFASFTGMLWKKGIEQRWADNPRLADPNLTVLRYADILLMHAESLIELNEDLSTARNLINQVRARAYGVGADQTDLYPVITETDQMGLRVRLRRERRVEFMREGLRYQDIIRWRIGNKAIARQVLGMPQPTTQDRNQWPFNDQILPVIDNDGVVLFESDQLISRDFASLLQTYSFDEQRMYLWPIPASDRFLNPNLTQNPGY